MAILKTKITAAQNEVKLSYHRVRGLFFWQLLFAENIILLETPKNLTIILNSFHIINMLQLTTYK